MAIDSVKVFFDLLARVKGERDVKQLGDAIEGVGDEATRTGRKFAETAKGTDALGTKMADTRTKIRELHEEFRRTGDMSLLRDIGKAERDVKRLSGWMQRFGDDSEDSSRKTGLLARALGSLGDSASTVGKAFQEAFKGGLSNPYVLAALGISAAVMAIPAAAAVAGAALTGLGGAVAGLGFLGVSHLESVNTALVDLGNDAMRVGRAASAGLERPFAHAFEVLRQGVVSIGPDLADMFSGIGPGIESVASGLVGLVQNAMPGLVHAVDAAGPALEAFGAMLPEIGSHLSTFFNSLGEAGPGAIKAFGWVLTGATTALELLGYALEYASKAFDWLTSLPGADTLLGLGGAAGHSAAGMNLASAASGVLSGSLKGTADAARQATFWTKSFAEASGLLKTSAIDVAQAELTSRDATASFAEAIKASKGAIGQQTDASRRAEAALISGVQAAAALSDKTFDLTLSGDRATAAFYSQVNALRAQTAAGSAARARVDALIGSFVASQSPAAQSAAAIGRINNQIALLRDKRVRAEARVDGGAEVARLQAQIDALHGKSLLITVNRQYSGVLSGRLDYFGHPMASGGPVRHFAGGGFSGRVIGAGTATSDSNPAMLSNDEYVIKAASVRKAGIGALNTLNRTGSMPVAAGGVSVTLVNQGVIGSQREMDNWLVKAIDGLKRQGRFA